MTSLSQALQKKAKEELHENVEDRPKHIFKLRKSLESDLALHCPQDDEFLLMFLRARKFDIERAASLVHRYYEVREEYADFYKRFRPSFSKENYEKGLYVPLPKVKDTDPQAILIRAAMWDPTSATIDDLFKGNIMIIEKMVRREDNQVNGLVILADMSNLTWNHVKSLSPFIAKKATSIIQQAMPCRLKGIHYINVPSFFEYVFAMIKPFLSEKLKSRIHIHSTPEYLKDHFDLKIIPKELGGELDVEPHVKDVAKLMEASEDEFISWEQYGIKKVEAVSGDSKKQADAVGGVTGTFKRLNVD